MRFSPQNVSVQSAACIAERLEVKDRFPKSRLLEPSVLDGLGRDRTYLVRVQFGGWWINKNWAVAYGHTHWIAYREGRVFDVNCGIHEIGEWISGTLAALIAADPQCDGKWYVTHVYEVGLTREYWANAFDDH